MSDHVSSAGGSAQAGSALVIALIFVAIWSIVLLAILSFAEVGFGIASGSGEQRDDLYAADGGVDAAIHALRGNPAWGRDDGTDCPTFNLGSGIAVDCVAMEDSGLPGDSPLTMPEQTILALATGGTGVAIRNTANDPPRVTVGGDVRTNAAFEAHNTKVTEVDGAINATSCLGAWVSADGTCGAPPAGGYTDPGDGGPYAASYVPRVLTPPAFAPAPTVSASGCLVEFHPGTYLNAAVLNAQTTSGCASGGEKIVHLRPGTYYFDFQDTPTWNVSHSAITVVGGTRDGSVCVPDAPNGIQLVFGGASRVSISDARMYLCAYPETDKQRIAVFGVPARFAGTDSIVSTTLTAAGPATSPVPASGHHAFADPANAVSMSSGSAQTGTLPQGDTASIRVGGYGTSVPGGATATTAQLVVRHGQQRPNQTATTVTLRPTVGAPVVVNVPTCPPSDAGDCTTTVEVTGLSPAQLGSFALDYAATVSHTNGGWAQLFGLQLAVTHASYVGGLRPTSATDAFDVVAVSGNPARLSVSGTVYAPLARLDLHLPNQAETIVNRGVIARRVTIHRPSSSQHPDVISLGGADGTDRLVLLTARDAADPSRVLVRSLISFHRFTDLPRVEHWNVVR